MSSQEKPTVLGLIAKEGESYLKGKIFDKVIERAKENPEVKKLLVKKARVEDKLFSLTGKTTLAKFSLKTIASKALPGIVDILVLAYEEHNDIERFKRSLGVYNVEETRRLAMMELEKSDEWQVVTDAEKSAIRRKVESRTDPLGNKLQKTEIMPDFDSEGEVQKEITSLAYAKNQALVDQYMAGNFEKIDDFNYVDKQLPMVVLVDSYIRKQLKMTDPEILGTDITGQYNQITKTMLGALKRPLEPGEIEWAKTRLLPIREKYKAALLNQQKQKTDAIAKLLAEVNGVDVTKEPYAGILQKMRTGNYDVEYLKLTKVLKQPGISSETDFEKDTDIQDLIQTQIKEENEQLEKIETIIKDIQIQGQRELDYTKYHQAQVQGKTELHQSNSIANKLRNYEDAQDIFKNEWTFESHMKIEEEHALLKKKYEDNIIIDSDGKPVFLLTDKKTNDVRDIYLKDYSTEDLAVYSLRKKVATNSEIKFNSEEQRRQFEEASRKGKAVKFLLDHDLQPSREAEENDLNIFRSSPRDNTELFEIYKKQMSEENKRYYEPVFNAYRNSEFKIEKDPQFPRSKVVEGEGLLHTMRYQRFHGLLPIETIKADNEVRKKKLEKEKKNQDKNLTDSSTRSILEERAYSSYQGPADMKPVAATGWIDQPINLSEEAASLKISCPVIPLPQASGLNYRHIINQDLAEIFDTLNKRLVLEVV